MRYHLQAVVGQIRGGPEDKSYVEALHLAGWESVNPISRSTKGKKEKVGCA